MKRHYIELWLLFAVSFAIFAVASAFEMPEIAGHKLRSSEIAETFIKSRTDVPLPPARDSLPLLSESLCVPAPCDTTSQVILLFGDSMLEGLGPRLAAYADANGHELYTVMWYSSTSRRWGETDRLRNYIRKLRPTFIFVCLGANEMFVRDIEQKHDKYVKNILADIGDIPYVWIGPPNWKPDTGINRLIRANTAEGSFFLSDGMEFRRVADGAHPTYESAHEWMDSVVRWIPVSRHPIKLDKPTKQTSRAKRVFVHKPNE